MPVLIPKFNAQDKSGEQLYTEGKEQAHIFFKKYLSYFSTFGDFVEIGNELDNKFIKGAEYNGDKRSHYKMDNRSIMYYKGFAEITKLYLPNKKLIINISYIHWGFLELLEDLSFDYDLIGLHWYSDMGNVYDFGKESLNIIDFLRDRFDKKVILTEFNVRAFDKKFNSTIQKKKWLVSNYESLFQNINCLGVIFYELFDEPDFAKMNSINSKTEAFYGLFSKGTNSIEYIKKEYYENLD